MFERAFVVEPLRVLLQAPRFRNETWDGLRKRLAALPLGSPSALQEDGDRYYAVMLLARGEGTLRQATVTWRKQPFAAWWGARRLAIRPARPEAAAYTLGTQSGSGITVEHWRRLSASFALDPRWYHSAVWTGSEMIVWGGISGETGGRYDPSTDRWVPTSKTNEPSWRYRHTAVWTG